MSYNREEHFKRLPTIRIHKAVLKNFKSVEYGEVIFDCSKQFVPYGTTSDILGIYGQNGSGKTAFIEALSIVKYVISGERIPFYYADCVSAGAECAELEFVFDLQYPTEPIVIRKVAYSFCLAVSEDSDLDKDENEMADMLDGLYSKQLIKRKLRVYNEVLKIAGEIDGENKKLLPTIDTSTKDAPFEPASKRKLFYKPSKELNGILKVHKKNAYEHSQSFIFMQEAREIFAQQETVTTYFEVLEELRYFAARYLYVIDTKSIGAIRANVFLPFYNRYSDEIIINTVGANIVSDKMLGLIEKVIKPVDDVLSQFIPGMSIYVKKLGPAMLDDGKEGKSIEIVVNREGNELPIRCASDGARKIISVLSLIIDAYNEKSLTVAIDEFDAGIYEYLLGEILQIFAESGKGQLIFTSHNLRPLEVLDKKFICFTTTNPQNRYYHLKNVGATNNLRRMYIQEIQVNEQDEEIYKATKKHKIIAALRKAGW